VWGGEAATMCVGDTAWARSNQGLARWSSQESQKKNRELWCAGHKQRELGAPATPSLCAESGDGAKVTNPEMGPK